MLFIVLYIHCRHEYRCIGEEIIHLFERPLLRLRLDRPEKEGISKIAYHLFTPSAILSYMLMN